MRIVAALLAAIVLIGDPALACSCSGLRAFGSRTGSPAVVFIGTVRQYLRAPHTERPTAMSVELESTLSGRYGASRIVIWGDLGASCVPYVTKFPIGTKFVFSVYGPTAIEDFGDENYHFGPCETDWLMIFDGNAIGLIDQSWMQTLGTQQELPVEELRRWLADRSAAVKPRRAFSMLPRVGEGIDAPKITERAEARIAANCPYDAAAVDVDVALDRNGAILTTRPPEIPPCVSYAVQTALARWKFGAPMRSGKPIAAWFRVPVPVR